MGLGGALDHPPEDLVDRRAARRSSLRIAASWIDCAGECAVVINNISTGGARVRVPLERDLFPGSLCWRGLDVPATPVWRRGREYGLSFDQPAQPAE